MKRLVIICSLVLISVVSLRAQFTFSDGFESGNFSAWDSVSNVHTDTTVKHSGTYAAKFTGTGAFSQTLFKHIPTSGYVRIEYFAYITSWRQAFAGFYIGFGGGWGWNPWATCGSYVVNCSGQKIGGITGSCAGYGPFQHMVPINCPMNQWNHFVLERTSNGNIKGWINSVPYFDLFVGSCLKDDVLISMFSESGYMTAYFDDVSISACAFGDDVAEKWNLVSVPVTVSDYRTTSVFPSAIPPAYAFDQDSGYVRRDTLENGPGYWLKFATAQTVTIPGWLRNVDTIDVSAGWNIVGSISYPVIVDSIVQTPPGVVVSDFFGYDGTYDSVHTLNPGKGYWVKASGAGSLILTSGTALRGRIGADAIKQERK